MKIEGQLFSLNVNHVLKIHFILFTIEFLIVKN